MFSHRSTALLGVLVLASTSFAQDERPVDLRHEGTVRAFAFAPDGKRLAVVGDAVVLWDLATGKPVMRFRGHAGSVLRVAFAPDGKVLAASAGDRTLLAWDVPTGKLPSRTTGGNLVGFIGRKTVLVSNGQGFSAWELDQKKPGRTWEIPCGIDPQPGLSPDGKLLAVAVGDSVVVHDTVKLADPGIASFRSDQTVQSVAVSADNRLAAVGSVTSLVLWDVASSRPHRGLFQSDGEDH